MNDTDFSNNLWLNYFNQNCKDDTVRNYLIELNNIYKKFENKWFRTNNQDVNDKLRLLRSSMSQLFSFYCSKDKEKEVMYLAICCYVFDNIDSSKINDILVVPPKCNISEYSQYINDFKKIWDIFRNRFIKTTNLKEKAPETYIFVEKEWKPKFEKVGLV
jgi:hypothetical protein